MKSISILGSGWLGKALVEHLSTRQYFCKISSRNTSLDFKSSNIQKYFIDIDKETQNISDFLDSKTLIINIPSKNVASFKKLIQKIEHSSIQNVLFVSSTSVCKNMNIDNPLYEIEGLFRKSKYFKTTILRFGGLIGYSRNPANFFKNKKVVQASNTKVNMIHRDDCISIIEEILKQNLWKQVLNACSDTHPSKEEFYTYACKQAGVSVPLFEETKVDTLEFIDNKELKILLNYEFIYPDLMQMDFRT